MASLICEQGDMGLWNTPLNKKDQQTFSEQYGENKKDDEKSVITETKADK